MGIIIPFPGRRNPSCRVDTPADYQKSPSKSYITSAEIESYLSARNKPRILDPGLLELEILVVFSPEIGTGSKSGHAQGSSCAQWGDVFLKIGDEYPFIFTLYTKKYVKNYFHLYGEIILPSPKDILLNRHVLAPQDLVQSTIKWVNSYYPALKGLPIHLESEEVIKELVCDPGNEVIIPDSTELLFL